MVENLLTRAAFVWASALVSASGQCLVDPQCQEMLYQSGSRGNCSYEAYQFYCGYSRPYCDVLITECDNGTQFSWSFDCQCY